MPAQSKGRSRGDQNGDGAATHVAGPRTLAIDIGGTGLKALVLDGRGEKLTERVRVETPRPATPEAIVNALIALVEPRSPRSARRSGTSGSRRCSTRSIRSGTRDGSMSAAETPSTFAWIFRRTYG